MYLDCYGKLTIFGDPAINISKNIAKKQNHLNQVLKLKIHLVFRPENAFLQYILQILN